MKIKIKSNELPKLADAFEKHPNNVLEKLSNVADVSAKDLEAKARKNAKWTDRTGQARRSINGSSSLNGTNIQIKLEGYAVQDKTEYFQYLEKAHRKKYAILEPTIKDSKDDVVNRYAKALSQIDLDI